MIEDLEDESHQQIYGNQSRVKPLFNPYQKRLQQAASTSQLALDVKQCRICLQGSDETQNPLISPCKCMGSVKFIHQKCFRKWIENVFKHQIRQQHVELIDQGIQCELCKTKIGLAFRHDYICCRGHNFCRKFRDQPISFMLFLFIFFIIVACEIYLGIKMGQNGAGFKDDIASGVVIVIAMVFLAATAVIIVYYCTKDYLLERIWILEGFKTAKRSEGRPRNMEIIPVDLD